MTNLLEASLEKLDFDSLKTGLSAFRSYDLRGLYPEQINSQIVYLAVKAFLQINPGERFVIGYDMRESSIELQNAITQSFREENKSVTSIGLSSTDLLYYATGSGDYDGGIMITASHNAAVFNGMKFVKKHVAPISMQELKDKYVEIKDNYDYKENTDLTEPTEKINLLNEFIEHVEGFNKNQEIKPLKLVIDAGNGMAGIGVTELLKKFPQIKYEQMYFEPHADFPHHEANPVIAENTLDLRKRVKQENADLGVAFDGDGDRVFFIDENGEIIPAYFISALIIKMMMAENPNSKYIYDSRYTFAIKDLFKTGSGDGILSPSGHTFVKEKMKSEDAIFGAESTSAHYYYRDNYSADSGLITLQLILRYMSETGKKISELVSEFRDKYFISGEINFFLQKQNIWDAIINELKEKYSAGDLSELDGIAIEFPKWRFSLRRSNTEPFIRLNIESYDRVTLYDKKTEMIGILTKYAKNTGNLSNLFSLKTMDMSKSEKINHLFSNLQFSWNSYKGNYLDELYGTRWARNRTPLDVIREIDPPDLDKFYERNQHNIEESVRLQQTYLNKQTWFEQKYKDDKALSILLENPVAYFSLEFGLVDWLQIYSGGLGILAGDTVKEASDSGIPFVGIGIFYHQGYFHQRFSKDGWQMEDYLPQDTDDYPLELIRDDEGRTIVVEVPVGERLVKVRGWRLSVGRKSLVLLDTNFEENEKWEDQMITAHLYGGTEETRIKQEIVLGIGGYKLIRAANIDPGVIHLNEGHSAFAIFARTAEIIKNEGIKFDEALKKAQSKILFTNHTLKKAGNDMFEYSLVEDHLGHYAYHELGVEFPKIFELGVDQMYTDGKFGMTILGMRNSKVANAVSKLHSRAAKKVWTNHELIPVTNGVHMPTWVSQPVHELLDEYVSEHWTDQGAGTDWQKIYEIPDKKLWEAHLKAKKELAKQISENCGVDFPTDSLIFGWFRRITAYKQPEILTLDLDRLDNLVNNSGKDIRFIFGGKAHPRDEHGKKILQSLYQTSQDPRFKGKLIIIPDYNWRMARYLYSGADVWVNSPVRYQEACGTSGMKAAANGLIQFTTIDGWIDEVENQKAVIKIDDNLNSNQYFDQIENVIVKNFYSGSGEGYSKEWLKLMKDWMFIALSEFGSDRMMRDYVEKLYRKVLS